MTMRVYIDTSVFGGFFDEEFEAATKHFFDVVFGGEDTVLISDTLMREMEDADEEER